MDLPSVEAAAARALVAQGLHVDDVDAAAVTVLADGRRAVLSLASLRRVLALVPADPDARVAAWAQAAAAALRGDLPADPAAHLAPRLLPAPDPRLWTRALHAELHLAVALDLPTHHRLLTPFDLPRLGLSMAAAHQAALARLGAPTPQPVDTLPGALRHAVGDGLDAARLLLLGREPGALAVVPARDLCWFVPLDHPQAAAIGRALHAAARAQADLPYPLSPHLWRVHPRGIERLA